VDTQRVLLVHHVQQPPSLQSLLPSPFSIHPKSGCNLVESLHCTSITLL
jgi:hypothetical protein